MSAATNAAVAPVFDGRNARRIVPTRAALGADVLGIDPANPTDADIALVKEAIRDHLVVRLRGYTISDPEFSRFAARFGAKQTAIPFRHATHGLHINRGILAERAGAFPPATIEDALALAEKLSFTRDGTRVYGLLLNMEDPSTPIDWVRGFGGDFITADYRVVVDQPPAIRAMTVMRELFRKGVMPRNVMTMKTEDIITFMQQGRGAMTNQPFSGQNRAGRHRRNARHRRGRAMGRDLRRRHPATPPRPCRRPPVTTLPRRRTHRGRRQGIATPPPPAARSRMCCPCPPRYRSPTARDGG